MDGYLGIDTQQNPDTSGFHILCRIWDWIF